ncbi:MAG: ferritin-like domain-containing protein [Acidobacteria bacterium]|nr:ferritin-like domain-containing protein [Acidobacteriota bacterium]
MPIIADKKKRERIIALLEKAYWMEMETVMNYIAASTNLDGVRAEEIKKSLAADVTAELGHAQLFAKRIKTLSGIVPGSQGFEAEQSFLQPPKRTTDVVSIIKGVIAAEESAIAHYNTVIKECDGIDYVTQDMVITILTDEQDHLREFEGFLKEYETK